MTANLIVNFLGTIFLIASVVLPAKKWGGHFIRTVFSSLSVGLFLANLIYSLCS